MHDQITGIAKHYKYLQIQTLRTLTEQEWKRQCLYEVFI